MQKPCDVQLLTHRRLVVPHDMTEFGQLQDITNTNVDCY